MSTSFLNGIVYISAENYATLKTDGTLTVNGTTYTYDLNTLYITNENVGSDSGDSSSSSALFDGGCVNNKMYYQTETYPYVPVADLTSGFLYHTKGGTTLTPKTISLSDLSDGDEVLKAGSINTLMLGVHTGVWADSSDDCKIGSNTGMSWLDYDPSADLSAVSQEVAGGAAFDCLVTAYKNLTADMKYVHNIKVIAGGSSGSCEFYFTVYNDTSTALTISDLVSTYTMSNKLTNINGYVATTSTTTAVYNAFFESSTAVHFNGASISCTGSTLSVTDTIVGRVVSA